jgi:predicted ArsR family transcriptional regulator
MLDKKAARRHLVALERQHEIERCYFSGEKWRVIA